MCAEEGGKLKPKRGPHLEESEVYLGEEATEFESMGQIPRRKQETGEEKLIKLEKRGVMKGRGAVMKEETIKGAS